MFRYQPDQIQAIFTFVKIQVENSKKKLNTPLHAHPICAIVISKSFHDGWTSGKSHKIAYGKL